MDYIRLFFHDQGSQPQQVAVAPQLAAWHQVDAETNRNVSYHQYAWWSSIGRMLSTIMYHSRYDEAASLQNLRFFLTTIAPNLGISRSTSHPSRTWPSFMTDDGTPMELSWDWGTGNNSPVVRYSIEPVGLDAGTPIDPHNQLVESQLLHQLLASAPKTHLQWFTHFRESLEDFPSVDSSGESHDTRVFYAFDFVDSKLMSKAYFFPGRKARYLNKTNLQVIQEAIMDAPYCSPKNTSALRVFGDWASQPTRSLELDMLAIDMVEPLKSRLKIYFRSRETSFDSVLEAMTLGGRLSTPAMTKGLQQLKDLWILLFGRQYDSHVSLPPVDHRTAGMLYNMEFKLGSRAPAVKIYLPVRHYSRSDSHVVRALSLHMSRYGRDAYMSGFKRSIQNLFSEKAMATGRGLQTYVGCSIRSDGSLRIVSYFNPQVKKLLSTR